MLSVDVNDKNQFTRLTAELKTLSTQAVEVGLWSGMVPEKVMTAAWVNEFGCAIRKTPKMRRFLGWLASTVGVQLDPTKGDPDYIIIPARSFLRRAVDEGHKEIDHLMSGLLDQVIRGRLNARSALFALGAKLEQMVKLTFNKVNEPPLHPLTVALKGSAKPLIGTTGLLRKSITHRIVPVSGGGGK